MAIISLEGVRFYAYHGFYAEEQVLGNEYILDVSVYVNVKQAAEADDLYESVNYETIYKLCQVEMKKPAKLIETLAQRIADRLEEHFETVKGVRLKIRKVHPPLGGRVDCASVEITNGAFAIPDRNTLKLLEGVAKEMDDID